MATTIVTVVPAQLAPLCDQQRAYATDIDSAERALPSPLEEMPPVEELDGLRRRATQGQVPNSVSENEASPVSQVSTERTLVSASSETNQQSQAYRIVTLTREAWQKVVSRIAPGISNKSTVVEEARRLIDYENDKRIVREKVDEATEGFPRLAALLNSNDSFAIFRGFGQCHARVLVQLQVEITELEKELQEQDKSDLVNVNFKYRLKSTGCEAEGHDSSKDVLSRLQAKLIEYDEFLFRYNQIRGLEKTPQRHYRSVLRWILMNKPLEKGYYDFIFHVEDFISVTGYTGQGGSAEKLSFFENCIENYLYKHPKSRLKSIFKTEVEARKTADQRVNHYSADRFAYAEKASVIVVANSCILMPVFLLFLVPMDRVAMAMTVLAFGFAFSIMLTVVTRGKPQEIIIGTIAQVLDNVADSARLTRRRYEAVLVTFLGNMNSGYGFSSGP